MIEISGVSRRFGEAYAVRDVSLTVPAGTILAVVGTSGSGKTTLLRMVNRLIQPSQGTIRVEGRDTASLPGFELRRRIGYVIQNNGLFPHRTVAQNIATVPRLLGWDRARIAARVEALLTLFQLEPQLYAGRYPQELSGGQQQRVGVARALAAEPRLLLMDEPFGALDPIIRARAQADLLRIQRATGTTIMLVTHDMEEAIALGTRIAVMDGGRLLQIATPEEILARPATPFIEDLLGSGERPFRLLSLATLEGLVEPGSADGPALPLATSRREALAELLWSGRQAAPVEGTDGRLIGVVHRDALLAQARRPDAKLPR